MSNNFFIDLILRLFSNNPKFFKWIQGASVVLLALSAAENALPATVAPNILVWAKSSTVWVSSIVAAIMAQLPNNSANKGAK